MEAPIHVSNVMLIDPSTGAATRVSYKVENVKKFVCLNAQVKY